jgi:2-oxoglutarate dehydrogenase E2 component (dihydrolipoamide succinyltransferase)
MAVEVRVPAAGESVTEVMVAEWLKAEGDRVQQDEPLVTLETDKATLDLPAPAAGVLARIVKARGETARVGDVLAILEEAPVGPAAGAAPAAAPATPHPPGVELAPGPAAAAGPTVPSPAAAAAGPGPSPAPAAPPEPRRGAPAAGVPPPGGRAEEVVPMTLLRRRIAERLVQAQRTAALLTTFNEIDMTAVLALRRAHQEAFQARHGVKLGLMSFFVKAAIEALARFPALNAEIRGTDIVYRHYFDIGIAVGGGRGLVVPVLRDAARLSFAETERAIADFARRAEADQLTLEELQGGTFTISNGGIYGSMLSTPIVNPPQSGILGLHAIQDRPVARDGQVVIRPMMYVALTYDHRIVDGREAVTFLRHVKACVEEPARILLDV